jgi:hypothetical protein
VIALAELLREDDPAGADAQLRDRGVIARAHHRRTEHAQTHLDGLRHRSTIIDFDRHDVPRVPRERARGDIASGDVQQRVVHRQVLLRPAGREDIATELDVDKAAAAHVVGVALEEAVGVAVDRLQIDAVDLELQRRCRRPDEASHPAVPERQPFLAARDGRVVDEIRFRDERAIVDAGKNRCRDGLTRPEEEAGRQGYDAKPESAGRHARHLSRIGVLL